MPTAMNLFPSILLHWWRYLEPSFWEKRSLESVLEGLTIEYGHLSSVPGTMTYCPSFVLQVSTSLHSAATPTPPSSWAWKWAFRRWSCPQSRNVTRPNHEPFSAASPGGWSWGEAALVAVWPPQLLLFIFSWAIQHSETLAPGPVLLCCLSPSHCQNSVACRFGCCLQLRQQSNLSFPLVPPTSVVYAWSTDITSLASRTCQRAQHKHRSGRASLMPVCSCSRRENLSTLFDFWVVITGDAFQKSLFVDVMDKHHKQGPHRKPSMPALFPLSSVENVMFSASSRAVASIQKEKNV